MKGKKYIRLLAAFAVMVLAVTTLLPGASAEAQPCRTCAENGLVFTGFTATTEFWKISETQCARVYKCNNEHKQLRYDEEGAFLDATDHAACINATCEAAAFCGNCQSWFGAPLGHIPAVDPAVTGTCSRPGLTEGSHCSRPGCGKVLVAQQTIIVPHTFDEGKVKKPTCFEEGSTTYTCKVCGFKQVSNVVSPLSHWYDAWEPCGDWNNSAPCKRPGCTHVKTTGCAKWDFVMVPAAGEAAESYTVCPVCGQLSDGGCLEMVESATAEAINCGIPQGDLLVRVGDLANGEKIMCIGHEFDARLGQITGLTKFTVPASVLEGYQLMLVDAEGGETTVEVVNKGVESSFVLDFHGDAHGHRTPVRILHLVPAEAPETEAAK